MRKRFALLVLAAAVACPASAQTQSTGQAPTFSVQTDLRQLAVSGALVLAGYSAPAVRPEAELLRRELRDGLATVDADLRARLRSFYTAHRRAGVDEEADAVRYRALAVSVNPPPSFVVPGTDSRLPDDVAPVVGFASLAGELYRTPQFRALLPRLAAAYEEAATRVARDVRPTVDETLAYLRSVPVERVEMPAVRDEKGNLLRPASTRLRRLKVFPDPLLSGRLVVVRDDLLDAGDEPFAQRVGDRYSVFAGDTVGRDDATVRLAVTRFVVEPIVDRNREALEDATAAVGAILARSDRARERFGLARLALVTDSLVSALGVRQLERKGRLTRSGALDVLGVAHERGEVLAIPFYERLERFEQVGMDIGVFYPDLLHSLDPARERGRLEQIASARAALAMEPKHAAVAGDAFAADILAADRLITEKRFSEARPILEKILAGSEGNARALFGLAQVVENTPDQTERDAGAEDADRAAAQVERLERAVNLYRRAALNASPREQWLASWSHVYAGRILDFLDLREEALEEYRAAVKLGDVAQGAFREAQRGLAEQYAPPDAAPAP